MTVPVHYDDYRVQRSPLSDFLEESTRAGLSRVVRRVGRGETVPLQAAPADLVAMFESRFFPEVSKAQAIDAQQPGLGKVIADQLEAHRQAFCRETGRCR